MFWYFRYLLQCRRCQLQYIFKRLQANLNEEWWIIMVPFLIPSLVNLHFGKAHLAHGPTNWWCFKLIKSTDFCWPKNWNSFCSENLNKLKGANADKVLITFITKDLPRQDGSNHCPYPVCQQICTPPFVDSESCQPLKHLARKKEAVASKFDRNQKRHTKLIYPHPSTVKLMVSTPSSEHEGFLGLPDHDVLHWRALRPSLGEILGDMCFFVFLPWLGDEFHPSKAVFRRLYMYICIYTYVYDIHIYMNIYIYIYVNYICKQYALIWKAGIMCVSFT